MRCSLFFHPRFQEKRDQLAGTPINGLRDLEGVELKHKVVNAQPALSQLNPLLICGFAVTNCGSS